MSTLAGRTGHVLGNVDHGGLHPWLPAEAPLEMPRQDIGPENPIRAEDVTLSAVDIGLRRAALAVSTLFFSALLLSAPIALSARGGYELLEIIAIGVFLALIVPIACWFCSGVAGFLILLNGREQEDLQFQPHPSVPQTRTALLMPVCNEDPWAAFERLAQIDASLARLGASEAFDIFVLSDSNARTGEQERAAYLAFRERAHSAAWYRRREINTERKAGNIADWVRRFGGAYDFMIVLDADSTMAGETVLRLVDAMERNPETGLIQTAPVIVGAETLFARVSQFGTRMYGRIAAAGYAWWTGAESSYWGHNAIVRVRAFAACCGLPILEGEKPFGGHILSHDVVEAALLRRGGWAVRLTAALDGSCEETPPTLLAFIRREQRWSQGNLQHLMLMGSQGLHPASRMQLVMGCIAYVSSPLWLLALIVSLVMALRSPVDWNAFFYFLNPQFSPFMLASFLSAVLLIGPKLLGGVLVLSRPRERRAFGGGRAVVKSIGAEIALSALLAPILMVANTRSVLQTLRGRDVGWLPQQRSADELPMSDAKLAMRPQFIVGLGFTAGLLFRPDLAITFAPIVLPLLYSARIAVWSSKVATGRAFADRGLLATPDDAGGTAVPAVLRPARGQAAAETYVPVRAAAALG